MDFSIPNLHLNDGHDMPAVAMGTSEKRQGKLGEIGRAVRNALAIGYRHFDCAFFYKNEGEIGEVLWETLREGDIKRQDLFITTKLPPHYNDPKYVKDALFTSMERLKVDYVDLYLIHSPVSIHKDQVDIGNMEKYFVRPADPKTFFNYVDHADVWREMEKLVEEGLTKSIGLSNFNQKQIQHILDNCKIKPANLQVECHAYFPQNNLVQFCKRNEIVVTAYAPIGSPGNISQDQSGLPILLNEPILKVIGDKHDKTPAQILLRWLIQRDIGVLPKSVRGDRLKENLDIFDFRLDAEDESNISELGAKNQRLITGHNPLKGSPHYPFDD